MVHVIIQNIECTESRKNMVWIHIHIDPYAIYGSIIFHIHMDSYASGPTTSRHSAVTIAALAGSKLQKGF